MKATLMLAALAMAPAAVTSAAAKDCRGHDAPPGVRVPDRPGCKPSSGSPARKAARPGSQAGFIDLGEGTQVRVSGRVRMESRIAR